MQNALFLWHVRRIYIRRVPKKGRIGAKKDAPRWGVFLSIVWFINNIYRFAKRIKTTLPHNSLFAPMVMRHYRKSSKLRLWRMVQNALFLWHVRRIYIRRVPKKGRIGAKKDAPRWGVFLSIVWFINNIYRFAKRIKTTLPHNSLFAPMVMRHYRKSSKKERETIIYLGARTHRLPASHQANRLMLLGSPPDMVRGARSPRAYACARQNI